MDKIQAGRQNQLHSNNTNSLSLWSFFFRVAAVYVIAVVAIVVVAVVIVAIADLPVRRYQSCTYVIKTINNICVRCLWLIIFTFAYGMVIAIINVLHSHSNAKMYVEVCCSWYHLMEWYNCKMSMALLWYVLSIIHAFRPSSIHLKIRAYNSHHYSFSLSSAVCCLPYFSFGQTIFIAFFGAQMFELRLWCTRALRLQRELFRDDVIGFCITFF